MARKRGKKQKQSGHNVSGGTFKPTSTNQNVDSEPLLLPANSSTSKSDMPEASPVVSLTKLADLALSMDSKPEIEVIPKQLTEQETLGLSEDRHRDLAATALVELADPILSSTFPREPTLPVKQLTEQETLEVQQDRLRNLAVIIIEGHYGIPDPDIKVVIEDELCPVLAETWNTEHTAERNIESLLNRYESNLRMKYGSRWNTAKSLVDSGWRSKDTMSCGTCRMTNHLQAITAKLMAPAPKGTSPLAMLKKQIEIFFSRGPNVACILWRNLHGAIMEDKVRVSDDAHDEPHNLSSWLNRTRHLGWSNWTQCLALVLAFAAERRVVRDAVHWAQTVRVPWKEERASSFEDFKSLFYSAKKKALEQGKTSVIGVQLLDVEVIRLAGTHKLKTEGKDGRPRFTELSIGFALCLGQEGFAVWQAWGDEEIGCYLDQYVEKGRANIHDWAQGEIMMAALEGVMASTVSPLGPLIGRLS